MKMSELCISEILNFKMKSHCLISTIPNNIRFYCLKNKPPPCFYNILVLFIIDRNRTFLWCIIYANSWYGCFKSGRRTFSAFGTLSANRSEKTYFFGPFSYNIIMLSNKRVIQMQSQPNDTTEQPILLYYYVMFWFNVNTIKDTFTTI